MTSSEIETGSIVQYAAPVDNDEAALRFVVIEVNGDRLLMRVTAATMPNWCPNLLPVETVLASDVEVVHE